MVDSQTLILKAKQLYEKSYFIREEEFMKIVEDSKKYPVVLENAIQKLEEEMRQCRKNAKDEYDWGMHQGFRDAIKIIKEM